MKNKKLLPVIFALAVFLAAAAYTFMTGTNPVFKIFGSTAKADSLDSEIPDNKLGDLSQMFNERGFYKSNGVSYDENEIINNFNGGLMYEIPMFSYKMAGDLNFDMKLVYNGNVNHQVILDDSAHYCAGSPPATKLNFNAPEWIISVNGFGVQTLNFESDFYTNPSGTGDAIQGTHIKKLIPGYHIDDRLKTAAENDRDRIFILAGDGSLITLVNNNSSASSDFFEGLYIGEGKENHMKANVYFYETDTSDTYRNRIVELMPGDGLIYEFHEYKRNYNDFNKYDPALRYNRPQVMILEHVRDRFGHMFSLTYSSSSTGYGRQLLQGVNNTELSYGYSGMIITDNNVGTYKLNYTSAVSFGEVTSNPKRIASLREIVNPSGQRARILNQSYPRTLSHITVDPFAHQQELRANDVFRITNFTNFLGGARTYEYIGGTAGIEIDYNTSLGSYNTLISTDGFTYGYGRDPFYTNMVYKKDEFDNGKHKSNTELNYVFIDSGITMANKKIDEHDYYTTSMKIESRDDSTVNDSKDISTIREYKVYPVRDFGTRNSEQIDIAGVTKQIREITLAADNSTYEDVKFSYEIGSGGSYGSADNAYSGSFLMKSKTDNMLGQGRTWTYLYKYKNDNFDSLVTQKTEVDPKGNKLLTYYKNHDIMLNFLQAQNTITPYHNLTYWKSAEYYKIGVDTALLRYDNSGSRDNFPGEGDTPGDVLLQRKSFVYINDTSNTEGYYGQLLKERTYNSSNFASYLETVYKYYKKDTTGSAAHIHFGLPFVEGNLKQIFKPNSEEEKYFYYPIHNVEGIRDSDYTTSIKDEFRVACRVKYNNGTEGVEYLEGIKNDHLPIRIDSYHRTGTNTSDSLKTIYMEYDNLGNPVHIVNENGYLTEFVYGGNGDYRRISAITLPGDFATGVRIDTITQINPGFYSDTVKLMSDGWGHYNSNENVLKYNINVHSLTSCNNIFYLIKHNYPDSTPNIYDVRGAFIKFEGQELPKFLSVADAKLDFWVMNFKRKIDYLPADSTHYMTQLSPVSVINGETIVTCPGEFHSSSPTIERGYSQNIYIDTFNTNCYKHNSISVSSMLGTLFGANKKLRGFYMTDSLIGGFFGDPLPPYLFELKFGFCSTWLDWANNYIPMLSIYGKIDATDTLKQVVTHGYTYKYDYNDTMHMVTVHSLRRDGTPPDEKVMTYHLDGFGNISTKDVYTNNSIGHEDYDEFISKYNFLNKPAKSIDARSLATKSSYDELGRQVKTENADNSTTQTAFAYSASLSSYFGGTLTGFTEKLTLTDETGRTFNKYFDAVGNMLREEKFVAGDHEGVIQETDTPYDPDTTFTGQDMPNQFITLTTDYKYDKLYRLTEVKTPNGKHIYYTYDAFGRQIKRRTPDAGTVQMTYDANNNLIYSQDSLQHAVNTLLNTYRSYDALNRLNVIGLVTFPSGSISENEDNGDNFFTDSVNAVADRVGSTDSVLVVNVYDTITTSAVSIFSDLPEGYSGSGRKFTKGNIVATAYRTNLGDAWNYKYYKYDARGRVIKLWNLIAGMPVKTIEYTYNSQNQATNMYYDPAKWDYKFSRYTYDTTGRLSNSGILKYIEEHSEGTSPDAPESDYDDETDAGVWSNEQFVSYNYNGNSQLDTLKFNGGSQKITYVYNNRNWINWINVTSPTVFRYVLLYNLNGTIRYQQFQGSYSDNFADRNSQGIVYTYDNSNRLLKANNVLYPDSLSHDIINNYDADGNFKSMKRYGATNNLADNFSYNYYSGTNKLADLKGGDGAVQFTYDLNGNVTGDSVNHLYGFKYDYRNLITEFRRWNVCGDCGFSIGDPQLESYKTNYYYDEAGNRVCKKIYKYSATQIYPITEDLDDVSGSWGLQSSENYIRDISGREIAVYSDTTLTQWNVFGLDNVGHIAAEGGKFFYMKDHLGTIRATIDTTNAVVSSNDFDCWGYQMENRSYDGSVTDSKYKFTTKERDFESGLNGKDGAGGYDYFGARYYNSRIANWTSIDPLFEKHIGWTPYNYVLENPIRLVDPDGKQVDALYVNIGATTDPLQAQAIEPGFKDEQGHTDIEFTGKSPGLYPMDLEYIFAPYLMRGLELPFALSRATTSGVLYNVVDKHTMVRMIERSITSEQIDEALISGEQLLGHESGYMTIINRNIEGGKNLVLGYDLKNNVIKTAIKMSNKKLDKLYRKLSPIIKEGLNESKNKILQEF